MSIIVSLDPGPCLSVCLSVSPCPSVSLPTHSPLLQSESSSFPSPPGSLSPYLFLSCLPLGPSRQPDLSLASLPCLGLHLPPRLCDAVTSASVPISPSLHLFLHLACFLFESLFPILWGPAPHPGSLSPSLNFSLSQHLTFSGV